MKYVAMRFLLPGAALGGAGYLLSSLGWTATWTLLLYIAAAIGLVALQGFFRMRRASNLRDLLFVSLFVILSTPLLQVPFTRMDNYGFYNLGILGGATLVLVIALCANLLVALIAALAFDLLWRWQYSGRGASKAYQRALWVAVPPLGFIYLWILSAANYGSWIGCAIILPIMAGVFAMLVVLRDESVRLTEWDRRFLLCCCMVITIILATFATGAGLAGYVQPSLLSITGHTLIHSWDISFAALGYPEQELTARYRMGYVWSAISCIAYLSIVLGGNLAATIYRLGGGHPPHPTADIGELPAAESSQPDSLRKRIKSLFDPGRLSGRPIYPEAA